MNFSRSSGFLLPLALLDGSNASHSIGGLITGDKTMCESTVSGSPSVTAINTEIVVPSGQSCFLKV